VAKLRASLDVSRYRAIALTLRARLRFAKTKLAGLRPKGLTQRQEGRKTGR